MLKTFTYKNSKGEVNKHTVYALSETPDHLMGIDALSVLKKDIDAEDKSFKESEEHPHSEWTHNWYEVGSKSYKTYSLLSLIASIKVAETEHKDFIVHHLDSKTAMKLASLSDDEALKAVSSGEKLSLADKKDIAKVPGLAKAIEDYDKLQDVLLNRPVTKYESLRECRAAGKKKIEGLEGQWMKSFKNFKKSGIVEE